MAKTKATSKAANSNSPKQFARKRLAFAGRIESAVLAQATKLATAEGAEIVDAAKSVPDYIVAGEGTGGKPPAIIARVQKKHPAVDVLDLPDFWALFLPTLDGYVAALTSGSNGYELRSELRAIISRAGLMINLDGVDLRKKDLSHGELNVEDVSGADLREANLSHTLFGKVERAKFDGAMMSDVSLRNAENCSFRNANLANTRINPAIFAECDFTGAILTEISGAYTQASDCKFDKADLSHTELEHSKFQGCTFRRAQFTGAKLVDCDFTGADLSGADLTDADLTDARLIGAIFSGAKLCGACLLNADLSKANVDKADFTDANVNGAVFQGVDLALAKEMSQPVPKHKEGPNLKELEQQAGKAQSLEISATFDIPNGFVVIQVGSNRWGVDANAAIEKDGRRVWVLGPRKVPVSASMLYFGQRFPGASLRPDSIELKVKKAALGTKELKSLSLAAWSEAFGQEIPDAEDLKAQEKVKRQGLAALRDEMLAELREGPKGVKKWNARKPEERKAAGDFRRVDFHGAKLAGVQFKEIDVREAKFDGADLVGASFDDALVEGASFQNTDLRNAWLAGTKGSDVNFTGADASGANLRGRSWKRACFQNANLNGADFSYANLSGTDLSSAKLKGSVFEETKFDETTIFPKGFEHGPGLKWAGKGTDPHLPKPKDLKLKEPLDLETFLSRLAENTESAKFEKALSMLKADRFKLYAQVEKESVVGVVKSQSDPDLVYSCRIAADGSYACCTQNLNICGGLRGSLCKHLLVLIVGLANGNELDLAEVDSWVSGSRARKHELEKNTMSEAFLRYKGAEAGEVDWRPTQTIPEDYYAL